MSVRMYQRGHTGRISAKFDSGDFYEHLSGRSKFDSNGTKISGALHEDPSMFRVGRDVCSAAIDSALLCCHGNACCIYYIVDSSMVRQQYKGKELLRFHGNTCYTNAPQCYIIRTLPGSLKMTVGRSHVSTEAKIIFFFGCKSYTLNCGNIIIKLMLHTFL
jgi:hypothetical protein